VKKLSILNKLRSSNLRPTKQRLEIAKFLFDREKTFHFTINQLEQEIKNHANSKISLATIYNTVHAFEKKGYLKQIPINSNQTYFDTNVSDHHHFYDLQDEKPKGNTTNQLFIGSTAELQKLLKKENAKTKE